MAPYHVHLIERAAATVAAQSLPCAFIPVIDTDKRGAAWARNEGLRQARTKFVTFLDADDELDQDFAARMVEFWQPNRYTYSDFFYGDELCTLPDGDALHVRDLGIVHHIVNCLMTKAAAVAVGGFPEHHSFEDTLFYLTLREKGICGVRCPYPLVRYNHKHGLRSAEAHQRPGWGKELRELMTSRPCNCGGGVVETYPRGEKQDGDVLVYCMWGSNRGHTGRVTGRRYEKNGHGMPAWIDPRDADAAPELYKRAEVITPDSQPDFETVRDEVLALAGA